MGKQRCAQVARPDLTGRCCVPVLRADVAPTQPVLSGTHNRQGNTLHRRALGQTPQKKEAPYLCDSMTARLKLAANAGPEAVRPEAVHLQRRPQEPTQRKQGCLSLACRNGVALLLHVVIAVHCASRAQAAGDTIQVDPSPRTTCHIIVAP